MKKKELYFRRLHSITDWPEQARKADFKVYVLARHIGVPEKVLQEFFKTTAGHSAHAYLSLLRRTAALQLLHQGVNSCKEIAACAGYCNAAQFTRDIKNSCGYCPTRFRRARPDFSI